MIFLSKVVPLHLLSEESFEDIPMIPVIFLYSPRAPPQSFSDYHVPCKYQYEQAFVQIANVFMKFAKCICPNGTNYPWSSSSRQKDKDQNEGFML